MTKSPDAFRTISEVADWLGIQAHVLRFWESKFSQVKPVKRAGGRRYYRPSDMQLLGGIKQLLYEDGLTIKGVQKILREQGVNHVTAMSPPLTESMGNAPAEDNAVIQDMANQGTDAPVEITEQPASQAEIVEPDSSTEMSEPEVAPEENGADGQEQLPLPSFTHQRGDERAPQPHAQAPAPEEAAEQPTDVTGPLTPDDVPAPPPEKTSLVVDAPDPPDEDEIPYNPGVLADLVKFGPLRAENVTAAKPLIRALDEWLQKVSDAA